MSEPVQSQTSAVAPQSVEAQSASAQSIEAEAPVAAPPDPHRWTILAVVGVAQLMIVLDVTIMNIALPSAQADLGFSTTNRQWVITAYSLAFGSLLLLGGRLSDLFGRRRTLFVGMLGFAAASALGGAATGFAMLVIARGLQGVFAALLAPAALSTLNVTFTDADERAKAFGVYAAIAAGGSVVGLIVGGMLTEWLSWRWCLYVNVVFAIPAAAAVLAYVRAREKASHQVRIDWPGVLLVTGGLFCLVYALSNAETHAWSDPVTVGLLVASGVLLVAFVVVETRVAEPLLPMRVLRDRNRAGSYLAIGLAFCSMFAAFLFLTYYLQDGLGYSPLMAGVAFLPVSAGIAIGAGGSNTQLVPRFGPRPVVPVGMLIGAGGMIWLAQLSPSSTYLGNVLGPMFILGLGMGLTFAPAINAATAGIARRDAGVGSAMVNTSQQIGGAIGAAALSTIFASAVTRYLISRLPPGLHLTINLSGSAPPSGSGHSPAQQAIANLVHASTIHGYTVAFSVSAGIFVVGAIVTALLLRSGPLPESDQQTPGAM